MTAIGGREGREGEGVGYSHPSRSSQSTHGEVGGGALGISPVGEGDEMGARLLHGGVWDWKGDERNLQAASPNEAREEALCADGGRAGAGSGEDEDICDATVLGSPWLGVIGL